VESSFNQFGHGLHRPHAVVIAERGRALQLRNRRLISYSLACHRKKKEREWPGDNNYLWPTHFSLRPRCAQSASVLARARNRLIAEAIRRAKTARPHRPPRRCVCLPSLKGQRLDSTYKFRFMIRCFIAARKSSFDAADNNLNDQSFSAGRNHETRNNAEIIPH
jgi:hypothetical protein